MPAHHTLLSAALALACAIAAPPAMQAQSPARPNVVIILADDLGWGSVGFQGQTLIRTPRIDALASQGLRFTSAYCPASVCAPTRAALLSGFHNGHTYVDRNGTDLTNGFRAADIHFAQRLRDAGYQTAAFGKWGFGSDPTGDNINAPDTLPAAKGFDTFRGYLNHAIAHDYTPAALWRNNPAAPNGVQKETYTGNYSHDTLAAEAEAFIRARAGDPDPFLLYVPFTIPHFDLDEISALPGYFDDYAGVPGSGGWSDKAKKYAAMITRMDASIGRLLDALEDPDGDGDTADSIAANTLVIFTSDNGPTEEDGSPVAFFDANGPYRGGKRDLWDGGVRVPLVYRWPGTILPGDSTRVTDLTDVAPTLAELAGTTMPPGIDGVSLLPVLTGQGIQRPRDFITFEHHEMDGGIDPDTKDPIWAIRRADRKLIKYSDGTLRLYDLAADPGETTPITDAPLAAELTAIALAEQVEQPDAFTVEHRDWTGAAGADPALDSNWSGTGTPGANWSAMFRNAGFADASSEAASPLTFLGLEVSGATAQQTLEIAPGNGLSARNGFRIGSNGRIVLKGASLETIRWTDVRAAGVLAGAGTVSGSVYNAGTIEPGLPADVAAPAPPPEIHTGLVTAITFNFSGVQNTQNLSAVSVQSPYLTLVSGLSYAAGLTPAAPATDVGNEYNLKGFNTANLASAHDASDYLAFSVSPSPGIQFTLHSIEFGFWRNGMNATTDHAITTAIGGHAAPLATLTLDRAVSGIGNQQTLNGTAPPGATANGTFEIRFAGWNAIGDGNTHFNVVTMVGEFDSLPEAPLAAREDTLSITGNLIQEPGGRVRIGIAGPGGKGIGHDLLAVGGSLSAAGTLEVELLGGYVPALGQTFDILDFAGFSGTFALDLPPLPSNLQWQTGMLSTNGTISVELRPGFHTWVAGFGLPETARDPDDDPDGDGRTNLEEYAFALDADPSHPDSAPVPEVRIEGGQLQIRYLRARADVTYQPETTTGLGHDDWATAGIQISAAEVGEIVTAWVPMSPEEPKRFLRVRLALR